MTTLARVAALALLVRAVAAAEPPAPRHEAFAKIEPELDALFQAKVGQRGFPGLAVGIVLDGQVVYAKGFGHRDLEKQARFDADSVFPIASVTKGLVAMAVLRLRDEGKLDLDAPLARFVPAAAKWRYPTTDAPPVTVRMLLDHASGLPEDNYWIDAAGEVSEADFARLLAAGPTFSATPGTEFEYSNTGFALLGKVIEAAAGEPAKAYVQRAILRPLGMSAATWDPDTVPAEHRVVGYRGQDGYRGKDDSRHPAPLHGLGAFGPAGDVLASLRDMTRYLAFHLSAWPPSDAPEAGPLRRATVREMHLGGRPGDSSRFPGAMFRTAPLARVREGALVMRVFSYGHGLFSARTCEDDLQVDHTGGLPGYSTYLTFFPRRGYGIVAFVNDERSTDPTAEATRLLRQRGVIDVREHPPVPALDAARAAVDGLLATWDEARARELFDPTFWNYQSTETFAGQLAALRTAHGACRPAGPLVPTNLTRGRWTLDCERGTVTFVAALSPEPRPRLQTLLWETTLPPSAALEKAAGRALPLLNAWDEKAAEALLAPGADRKKVRRSLGRVALEAGMCRLGSALAGDGSTTARFALACDDGNAELSLTLAAGSELLQDLGAARVTGSPYCR